MPRIIPSIRVALVAALMGCAGCGGPHALARADVPVYSLERVQAELQAGQGAFPLPERGVIVKVDKGTRLPLALDVALPFASIEAGANFVRVEHELFLYLSRAGLELSPDGRRWARVEDLRGLKRLFSGGHGGSFSIGAGIDRTGPLVSVSLKSRGVTK